MYGVKIGNWALIFENHPMKNSLRLFDLLSCDYKTGFWSDIFRHDHCDYSYDWGYYPTCGDQCSCGHKYHQGSIGCDFKKRFIPFWSVSLFVELCYSFSHSSLRSFLSSDEVEEGGRLLNLRRLLKSFGHQGNRSEGTALRRRRGTLSLFAWARIPNKRTASRKYFFILKLFGIIPRFMDFFKFHWAIKIWEAISFIPLGTEKGVRVCWRRNRRVCVE